MSLYKFDDNVAKEVSVQDAVVFEYIYYWVKHNKKVELKENYKDGKYWTWGSCKSLSDKYLPFLSPSQISRSIEALVKADLIKVGCFNEKKYDKTKWYTITKKGEELREPPLNERDSEKYAEIKREERETGIRAF